MGGPVYGDMGSISAMERYIHWSLFLDVLDVATFRANTLDKEKRDAMYRIISQGVAQELAFIRSRYR